MTKKKNSYHHGDLRRALLDAGLALLEEQGLVALSLRRVAAAAGVSHAAPAHYFPSLKHLLSALAAIGFERFGAAMAKERELAPKNPKAQMQAAGRGYVGFAIKNKGLFRLMFSKALLDWDEASLRIAANASFFQLEDISRPAAEILGLKSERSQKDLQKLVWSVVHGYAHLYIEGQMTWSDEDATPIPPDIAEYIFAHEKATN
jgi:AcrR family transcriptional regulator